MKKIAVVVIAMVTLFVVGMLWTPVPAQVLICNSTVSIAPGSHCWLVCPAGDGPALSSLATNATIFLTIRDNSNNPIPGIPAADFWLVGAHANLALWNGSMCINATAPTNLNGETTIAGAMNGGGCDHPVNVVVQGIVLTEGPLCTPIDLDIMARSPDVNGDLVVSLVDLADFANAYPPGGVYNACVDFNCDGVINLVDFVDFANLWQHICP
jgi:hypothetical protein